MYKKKSVMVSDTRGNKSFLAVRMRKTSLLSLSLPLLSERCASRYVSYTYGWRVSTFVSSKNIETTQYRLTLHDQTCASILVGNEAPRLRLFVVPPDFSFSLPPLFSTLLPAPKTRHNRSTKFFSVRDGPSPTFAAKFLARPSREPRPKQGETCQGRGMLGIPPHFGRPSLKARRNSRRRNVQVRSRSRNGRDVSRSVAGGGKRRGRTDWSERIAVAGSWVWGERERERKRETTK